MNYHSFIILKKWLSYNIIRKLQRNCISVQPGLMRFHVFSGKEAGSDIVPERKERTTRADGNIGSEFYEHVTRALRGVRARDSLLSSVIPGQIGGTVDIGLYSTFWRLSGRRYQQLLSTFHNPMPEVFPVSGVTLDYHSRGGSRDSMIWNFCSKLENEPDLVFVPITTRN